MAKRTQKRDREERKKTTSTTRRARVKKKQYEREWQVIGKELKRQQDQLSHFTDEVRDAAKLQESLNRRKQPEEYHTQARDLAGQLQKHIALLKSHIDTLEEQKEHWKT